MATIETRKVLTGFKPDNTPIYRNSYRVKVRVKNHPHETKTFERRTDAKLWGQAVEADMRADRYTKTAESKRRTLAELIDRYVTEILPNKAASTQRSQRQQLSWWKERYGHYVLADITSDLLSQAMSALAVSANGKPRAPATIVLYLAPISHAFSKAVKWDWLDSNPIEKIDKPPVENERIRYLSDDEKTALLSACKESQNPYLYVIVLIAIATGARKSEIRDLKWSDVDLNAETPRILYRKTKNGDPKSIPIIRPVAEALGEFAKVRRLGSPFLFPGSSATTGIDFRSAWRTAVKKANVKDFRFHDLRHTCASYLAMSGASTFESMAVLGHRSVQMSKRYSHIGQQHTAAVLDRMAERFMK